MNTKVRTQVFEYYTELKILIRHPMENGRNREPVSTNLIPAHFIRRLVVKVNDQTIIDARLSGGLSKNPFFTFRLKDASPGDKLSVYWVDNLGLEENVEQIIE